MAYTNDGHRTPLVHLYDSSGKLYRRSAKTRNAAEVAKLEDALRGVRALPLYVSLLDRVATNRLSLVALRDAYEERTKVAGRTVYVGLDRLLAAAEDVDLGTTIDGFARAMRGKVEVDTAQHYVSAIRTLIPKGTSYSRSTLTTSALQDHLDWMENVEPATVRKRGIGIGRWTAWLVKSGALVRDPMDGVELPPAGKPRVCFLETSDAIQLADAQESPYREFSALLAGSGIEVSVALGLRVRDVDRTTREIRAAGTKTYNRDRIARVAEWAWPYVETAMAGAHGDAKLFAGIPDRWIARDEHNIARAALLEKSSIFDGYTMRDARHTWAVRAARSGWPVELIARQLGHANGVLVLKVYGRFLPTTREREHWETVAAARDEARKHDSAQRGQ